MGMTDNDIIGVILKNEGGYTNNPHDHGGPTNFGITAADYGRWLGQKIPATATQVEAMTVTVAQQIYQKWYINDAGFGPIPDDKLKLVLVDSGVLHGIARASKWLQTELKISADGKCGPATLTSLASYQGKDKIAARVLERRFAAIVAIVKQDPSQMTFLGGWIDRAARLVEYL